MVVRVACVVVGVLGVGFAAQAQQSNVLRPVAAMAAATAPGAAAAAPGAAATTVAVKKPAAKKPAPARSAKKPGKKPRVAGRPPPDEAAPAAKPPGESVGWRVIDDPATGIRLGLPTKLVPKTETTQNGSRWSSGQGQIQIETFRLREAALPALFEQEKKAAKRSIESSELKPASFVISGSQGLKNFIERAELRGTEVRGMTILYDQATQGIMIGIAAAISSSFQGFPDPNAGPPPGARRAVEYGTATVVTSSGALLALAQVTDECQSITVPGFGHAERIAADKPRDLALLRLHGAKNLTAAALAADGAKTEALTLFGIADPLAQAGGSAVSSAAARLTPQGLDPAPKLGFAGAPAVDAQGRFVGVVELQSPRVAGAGAAIQQATLVPADAVRAFLQAQGVPLATSQGPMNQSVVRVICVRK